MASRLHRWPRRQHSLTLAIIGMALSEIDGWMARAGQLYSAGKLPEAAQLCRQVITREPNHADAMVMLAVICMHGGDNRSAVTHLKKAISLRPNVAEFHVNLAPALQALGRYDEAIATCRRAIELNGNLLGAYHNLAQAHQSSLHFDLAEEASRKTISLQPSYAPAHNLLALSLQCQERAEEAEAAARKAIELAPAFPQAWSTLCMVLMDQGRLGEAIAAVEQAIKLRPMMATAHYNHATALLLTGKLDEGFAEYEWRWQCPWYDDLNRQYPSLPWNGRPLPGKTILLHAEQGFGDVIQMIRYVPLVAERCGKVIVACQKELHRLLANVPGISKLIDVDNRDERFDAHLAIMSLPHIMGTRLETIPSQSPGLHTDAGLCELWSRRMSGVAGNRRVGVAWAGNPLHGNDRNRSIALPRFAPLADVSKITWYSLQKSPAGASALMPLPLIDFTSEFDDFAATAAFISNLDLIITADTAVAHLAGAMGKPVWVLLPFAPDWRWMRDRTDSPWYPTARLFRQPARGEWTSVIASVREALLSYGK